MAKRVRRSNVKDGVLLPLGNGFSLVKGDNPNKTDDVDIGPNNKNGLSVNHGEILQQQGNTLRVFSAEPMLGGVSPVQLLYGGMAPDKVFAMQEAFKDIHGINDDGSRAQFGILRKIKEKLSGKSNNINTQTPVKEQEYLSYFDATDEQKKQLIDRKGNYDIYSIGNNNDTHFSVVESRYKSLTDSMRRKGFTSEEIDRLSPFLITQQVLEGGYNLTSPNNNFGGILIPGTNKKMSFKSADEFNDYYLANLDEKWGDDYLGKGKGWRNAKTLKEYADIINREDLKLYTKEAHEEYNRNHKDKPAYIYTPLWQNNNTGLMSEPKFGGIYPRVSGMLDLLKTRIEDWNNIAKTNNIVKKEFGGRIKLRTGEDNIPMRIDSEGNLIDLIQPSVVIAKLPAKFNGSQNVAARYAEGYKFGKKVAQQRDSVTKQVIDKVLPTNFNKDLDDNVLGYTPIVGDILQGAQGVKDISKGNYLKGAVGLGLLAAPNIIEKPLKKGYKFIKIIKNGGYNKFKHTIPTELYKKLNQFNIDDIRKSVIDYQQFRDLERGAININPYNEAKTIKLRPASRTEIKINNKGKTESNVGLVKAGAINTGNEIILYPNEMSKGTIGHELRHSIMNNLTAFNNEDYLIRPGYQTVNIFDTVIERNPTPIGSKILSKNKDNWFKQVDEFDAELEYLRQTYAPNTTYKELLIGKGKPNSIYSKFINYLKPRFNITENEADTIMKELYDAGFKFGGQTNINSLGERPNAKYRKQMKNKRNKAALGRQQFSISGLPAFDFTIPNSFGNYSLNKPFIATYGSAKLKPISSTLNLPTMDFTPKSTVDQIDPFMGTKPAFGTSTTATPTTNPVGDLTKGSGLSTTAMSAIGAGINTLGSLIGAGIQQAAINGIKAPQRQYTLLNPVKLKTKININPQIARMREMQAQLADAARRTSGSSRTVYQKILANHNRLLDSAMDLYGRKENIETELINRDRLNQQQVAQANATNVMNTVNYNNESNVNNENYKRVATSNNWTNALNTIAGAWAGPNGFIDRANALRVKAGELYTQAIANPTAARLLYGDIDFTTGANKRKAFNTIYDFLNNSRFA